MVKRDLLFMPAIGESVGRNTSKFIIVNDKLIENHIELGSDNANVMVMRKKCHCSFVLIPF